MQLSQLRSIEAKLREVHQEATSSSVSSSYVETSDVVNLSLIDASASSDAFFMSPASLPQLHGLNRLCDKLKAILDAGYMHQKGEMIRLDIDIKSCSDFIHLHGSDLKGSQYVSYSSISSSSNSSSSNSSSSSRCRIIDPHPSKNTTVDLLELYDGPTSNRSSMIRNTSDKTNYNSINSGSSSSSGGSSNSRSSIDQVMSGEDGTSYNVLPDPEGEAESSTGSSGGSTPAIADLRQQNQDLLRRIRLQIQNLYSDYQKLYDLKTIALQVSVSSLEHYSRNMELQASQMGISNANVKVKLACRLNVEELMNHCFFAVSDVQIAMEAIKVLWSKVHFQGDASLIERQLQLSSRATLSEISIDADYGAYSFNTYVKGGCAITLLIWAFSECFNNEKNNRHIWDDPYFPLFMSFGDLLLLLWMWGISIYVWRSHKINFIKLLGLEGTELENHPQPERLVFESALDLSLIFFLVFISFNKAMRGVFDLAGNQLVGRAMAICMALYYMYRIATPWTTRKRWLSMLYHVLAAPFFAINFRAGYVGDLLTSTVRVALSMCFSFTYIIMHSAGYFKFYSGENYDNASHEMSAAPNHQVSASLWWSDTTFYRFVLIPIITLSPLWIRLMQCLRRCVETGKRWPHLGNATKYTSAMGVISFGLFNPSLRSNYIWIAFFVFATIFQFAWDLTMDWGIITSVNASNCDGDYVFLGLIAIRKPRLFGPLWIYSSVIIGNLFLRFAWTLTLMQTDKTTLGDSPIITTFFYHLGPIIAACEICRRMVWGFLRLEYEQLEALGDPNVFTSPSAASTIASSTSSPNKFVGISYAIANDNDNDDDDDEMSRKLSINNIDRKESSSSWKLKRDFLASLDWTNYFKDFLENSNYFPTVFCGLKFHVATLDQRARLYECALFTICVSSMLIWAVVYMK